MISLMGALLAVTEARFRGRVMGARQLAVYGMPLGLIACGILTERAGYSLTVTIACAFGLLCTALIGLRWRMEPAATASASRTA
jgi:hypothetical protein